MQEFDNTVTEDAVNETAIQNQIRLAVAKHGVRCFRNQVGTYKLADGRWLSSGLCNGSSDLIGWNSIIVTPPMVGQRIAVFAAIEVKTATGRPSTEQINFLSCVQAAGGIAVLARSPEEAVDSVLRFSQHPGKVDQSHGT